jgi:cob(I)alamin adenosyltransferase
LKIYTKKGDDGETSLFGGGRVSKNSPRIEACGAVDELNAQLGIVLSLEPQPDISVIIERIQGDLFTLGADLATPPSVESARILRINEVHIRELEKTIDKLEALLKPLQSFVLPGGSHVSAHLHAARTICRRAERRIVQLSRTEPAGAPTIAYVNRLSDLLFVLARYANSLEGRSDITWSAPGE